MVLRLDPLLDIFQIIEFINLLYIVKFLKCGNCLQGGKVHNWLDFRIFDLLGIQRVMLGPTALPFDSFSDFTRNYLHDYPQI